MRALLSLAALLAGVPGDRAHPRTHDAEQRIAYIESAIEAVRKTPQEARDHAYEYARVLDQGACSSAVERLKVDCMITATNRYCRKKPAAETEACKRVMDVVVSNVLASQRLIPWEMRYEIMRRAKDYKKEIAEQMRRIEGAFAVDFRLRTKIDDDAHLADSIDRYCLLTADDSNLAWQACASSLIWFIATTSG
jgi:hypothetical protein